MNAVVAAVVVVAAAGLSTAGGFAAGRTLAPPCRLADFKVSTGPDWSEATGQHTLILRLTSDARRTCTLDGFPQVTFSDRHGRIPFVINHRGDQMIARRRPEPVAVEPHHAAWVALNKYRYDRGSRRVTTLLRVARRGEPGGGARFVVSGRSPDYCGKGDPGSVVTVSPFAATFWGAMGRPKP
jgi:hypothetical protein